MQAQGKDLKISVEDFENLKAENLYLRVQLAELKRLIYGSKSERFIAHPKEQLVLFDQQVKEPEPKQEQISYTRKKAKQENPPVRTALPAHLPRKEEIIEPENLRSDAQKIGEEVTEILEYHPGNIYVRRIVRPKYKQEGSITIAALPSLPLPKSNAGASMLAHLAVSKFVDHLPFYRQIQQFKRQGITLSDATIGGWFNAMSKLLVPLYETLEKQVLEADYLQMDESPIGVQDNHKKGSLHTGYQWVTHNPIQGLVLFKYYPGRARAIPEELLSKYKGTLQTDGYQAYQNLRTQHPITLLACMAHGRRYFEKALKNDSKRAQYAMSEIQKLYAIERKVKDRKVTPEVIQRYRQIKAKPIMEQLEKWMKAQLSEVLPKSSMGKALAYNLSIWPNMKTYLTDGRYQIDNNLIENTIRPLALGRKNYLFAGSHEAAQHAAMMYSFFATCKINQIEPLQWLTQTLEKISETKLSQLHTLLPLAKD